ASWARYFLDLRTVFCSSGCLKRRSTRTVIVCSFLSEVTTPCRIRLGMSRVLSVRRRCRGFLVQNRLDAGDVTADGTHAGGVLKLAGGLLEAQVEGFLLELGQLLAKL